MFELTYALDKYRRDIIGLSLINSVELFQAVHHHSTKLLQVTERWTRYQDTGEAMDVICLDFCKVLQDVGITAKVVEWIASFLARRHQ